jgi:thymidylate kinase
MRTIAFEGVDYCGKSTQVSLLRKATDCVSIRRPGGTPSCESIRDLVKHSRTSLDWKTEQILLAAEHNACVRYVRSDQYAQSAASLHASLDLIVFDRWNPISALAYGKQADLTPDYLKRLYDITDQFILDFLFIIVAPWDVIRARRDACLRELSCNIEARGDDYLEAVCDVYSRMVSIDGFLPYVAGFARRVIELDGTKPAADLHLEVLRKLESASEGSA